MNRLDSTTCRSLTFLNFYVAQHCQEYNDFIYQIIKCFQNLVAEEAANVSVM